MGRILLAALFLAGCAAVPSAPEERREAAKAEPPLAEIAGPAAVTAPAPAPPPAEFPAPASLPSGDRWYVAWRRESGPEPIAVRHRRSAGDGFLREEVTWGRSFGDLAAMEHGVAQVFAVSLGEKGLSFGTLDGAGRPSGESLVEVAAPFRPGNAWEVRMGGMAVTGRIAAIERVETPGGPVEALRVEHRSGPPRAATSTLWYDRGLRAVRFEVRGPGGELLEATAALASATPTPEECRAAMAWAKGNLAAPAR